MRKNDQQPSLFDQPALARWSDPDTSKAAAAEMEPQRVTRLMQIVVDTLERIGKRGTLEDVCDAADWQSPGDVRQSLSPRFRPLVRMGKIRDSGERQIMRSGRQGIVWEICE